MGKIIYDPKNKIKEQKDEMVQHFEKTHKREERIDRLIENLSSVRPVGDTDCDYAIYLEDYVYTYLYQFANTDLAIEHAGAVIGEYYPETKEVIICGVMPISKYKLENEYEWINEESLQELYDEKEKYFPGAVILGWVHMQPGYGTMLTTKEVKVHRDLFDQEGTFLLLVDPISRIETFYAYEGSMLKEQSGYYIYYDKNPSMQQFMLDKPFTYNEKEEVDDKAVNQFREINRRRHKEYQDRRRTNFTVITASIALLAMAAVVLRIQEQNNVINQMAGQLNNYENKTSITSQDEMISQTVFNGQEDKPSEPVFIIEEVKTSSGEEESQEVSQEVEEVESEEAVEVSQVVEESELEDIDQEVIEEEVEEVIEEEVVEVAEVAVSEEEVAQKMHVVESGETLRSISVKYYNTELRAKDIIELNEMDNGDFIFVGQKLVLPEE